MNGKERNACPLADRSRSSEGLNSSQSHNEGGMPGSQWHKRDLGRDGLVRAQL